MFNVNTYVVLDTGKHALLACYVVTLPSYRYSIYIYIYIYIYVVYNWLTGCCNKLSVALAHYIYNKTFPYGTIYTSCFFLSHLSDISSNFSFKELNIA